jgi:hypothetical protein
MIIFFFLKLDFKSEHIMDKVNQNQRMIILGLATGFFAFFYKKSI